ncbi:uncharacterized protein LOC123536267 isoform X2 [Mercenaria mercenaria]|uniref:uncharacterized protein LOC123536267 isoform X2 n=1 Tax=Mercenaria mercenaria TaxID=6596 RepID=UPI001E1E2216|nr:uncharacterized protein LOC123536267 isoform X2 [Mercenaria mercenaria]
MKKAHLNKWRKERLLSTNDNPHGCAETSCPKESYPRSYSSQYHYVLSLIPISPAHGGESGTDHTSDMDLSQGSLDLSRTGPYYKSPPIPQPPPLTMRPVQNQSPISPVPNGQQNGCLDLSRSANSTPNTYMHYSGGTSINLSQGITQEQSQYYQLPRIKLEPGLGIDPTITYKPEMDYNHNEHMTSPAIPVPSRTAYDLSYEQNINDRIKNEEEEMNTGCEQVSRDAARDMSSEPRVTVETINANCIPLTVMSQDDENDSGTESIDSKDSDACSNLNINENGTGQKTDRKRPGRKKGQVSKVYHLWEFIRDVLNDPRYCGKVIKWENEEEGIFRVVQSETAASMWGQKKNNRTKMTYEKMSRSIRYSRKEGYFDDLPKDKGYPKKLCFKFGKKAHGWNTTRKPVLTQSNCVPPTV